MEHKPNQTGSAMEGGGYYNRHSAMQAAGIARVLPTWEKIAGTVPVGDETIVIADPGDARASTAQQDPAAAQIADPGNARASTVPAASASTLASTPTAASATRSANSRKRWG